MGHLFLDNHFAKPYFNIFFYFSESKNVINNKLYFKKKKKHSWQILINLLSYKNALYCPFQVIECNIY